MIAGQKCLGHSLRRPECEKAPFSVEGYRPDGTRLEPQDRVTERDLPIVCKRMPGEQRMLRLKPYRSEEEKIEAWVDYAAWRWQGLLHEHAGKRKAERADMPPRKKVPRGIPSSMLRPAETEQEEEVAMLGPSGTLVVWRDAGTDDFLLK